MYIKICGNMEKASVDAAARFGATHVGFIMTAGFRRSVTAERVAAMTADLPAGVQKVGVFANEPVSRVLATAEAAGLDVIQLHGHEDADYIRQLGPRPIIKAVSSDKMPEIASQYAEFDNVTLLLDSPKGGSGATFNWTTLDLSGVAFPYFVAGGLNPENVADAIRQFPDAAGVDVSSGVETDGEKDSEKIRQFILNAMTEVVTDPNFSAELSKKFDEYDAQMNKSFINEDFQLKIAPNGEFRAGLTARRMGNCLDIRQLFVAEEFRKQGLGGFLLDKVEAYAREHGLRYMTVNTLSIYAPEYYQRFGFEIYHRMADCPVDGMDMLRLQKEL